MRLHASRKAPYQDPIANVGIGSTLGLLIGVVGGALLPGPDALLQAIFGCFLAGPVGLVCGVVAAIMRWPHRFVVLLSVLQLAGGLALGYALYNPISLGIGPPLCGQAGGAALGIVYGMFFVEPAPRRGQCPRCGYDLTGLAVPRCPECGRPVGVGKLERVEESTR